MEEPEQLKRDNEVLYRDNVALSETADRLREALEELASNFNAIRSASQPYADMIDSWHYIARAALEAEKAVMWGVEPKVIPESGGHIESADCWCSPTVEEHPGGRLVIHNQTH